MKHILFICSRNRLRSPTAEQVISDKYPEVAVSSAGLNPDADVILSPDLLEWADTIFVMEKMHRKKLKEKFKPWLNKQSIICLNIPDKYKYMDPELIKLLLAKVPPHL